MAEWNPKANDLFARAAEIESPGDRSLFLDEQCAGDVALRQQVEALLAASAQAGSFLNRPAVEATAAWGGTSVVAKPGEGPGTVLGHYKLLQQIGEGGFGEVYMAEQQHPVRRKVALKILKSGMDTQEVIARFESERQALALMDHPNIAKVLDAGTTESGRPFFVMELVHGVPITQFCDENQLTTRQRLKLFVPVCHAIQHAHQKGVIHRDVKPSNVLVTLFDDKPVPKVIDFGVAKAVEQRLTEKTLFTQFGALVGTFEYMSPEQASMNALGVDTRSDIYSLGVLLYELLTGSTPLERQRLRGAAYAEVLRRITEEEPPRPSTRISSSVQTLDTVGRQRKTEPTKLARLVRGDLDWIAMKCLEKDRTRRYETASGLARDVERYLRDEPVEACPPSVSYRLGKFWRRNRGPVLAAAVVLLALVGGIIGTTWGLIGAERAWDAEAGQRQVAQARERDAELEKRKALEAAEEEKKARDAAVRAKEAEAGERKKAEDERDAKGKALVRAEGLRLTAQSSAELHTDPSLGLLLAIEAARVAPSKEATEALYAALDACREARTLSGHAGPAISARFTPDGRGIVSCAKDGTARGWDAETGKQVFATPGFGPLGGQLMADTVLSPDGKSFVTLHAGVAYIEQRDGKRVEYTDRVARLWDTATGKQLAVLRGHTGRVRSAAFSPDGERLVTTSYDTTARVWELPSGKPLAVLKGHAGTPYSARFSPDGRRVWTVSTGHQALKPAAAAATPAVDTDPDEIRTPAEALGQGHGASDSGFPPYNEHETTLARVWDAETGKEVATLSKPKGFLGKQAEVPLFGHFSADGARVVFGFMDDAQVWDVEAGKVLFRLKHAGMSGEDHVAWSQDGKRLATIRGNYVSIWDAADGKELTTLRGHESTLRTLSFSPDGRLVLTTSWDRTARVWNAQTGEPVAVLRGHTGRVHTASLSPDGRRVVTAAEDGTVRVWWLDPPRDHCRPLAEPIINFRVMALSTDGRYLATGAEDYSKPGPRIWDAATGRLLHKLKAPREGFLAKLPDRDGFATVTGVVFSPDGRRLLSVADEELIKVRKGGPTPAWTFPFLSKPKPPPADPDAGAETDEAQPFTPARIWDVETGKQLVALQAGENGLSCAAFSRDGRKVLTADSTRRRYAVYSAAGGQITGGTSVGGDFPTFARIHDAATGKELLKLPHEGEILRAEFSADGRRVLTSGNSHRSPNQDIKVWDAETGKLLYGLAKSSSERVACFDPDGKRVVVFDNPIRLHDAAGGKELARFEGFDVWGQNWNGRSLGLSPFSPDGKTLLAFGKDGLGLLDAETGKQLVAFRGHFGAVTSALFGAGGRFVVTASDDQTARVWDATTGKEVVLLRHRAGVPFAFMTSDGRRVATAGDGVRVWDLDPLPVALRRTPRELSPYERERFGIK